MVACGWKAKTSAHLLVNKEDKKAWRSLFAPTPTNDKGFLFLAKPPRVLIYLFFVFVFLTCLIFGWLVGFVCRKWWKRGEGEGRRRTRARGRDSFMKKAMIWCWWMLMDVVVVKHYQIVNVYVFIHILWVLEDFFSVAEQKGNGWQINIDWKLLCGGVWEGIKMLS